MKSVMILTDFSAAARRAAEQALVIAAQFSAEVWLVNVYPITPYLPPVGMAVLPERTAEQKRRESMNKLNREVRRLERLRRALPGQRQVIRPLAMEGRLAERVEALAHRKKSLLIAMGVSSRSYGNLLFSGDVKALLQQVRCPILATPPGCLRSGIRHILFATDLDPGDEAVIGDLSELASRLKARLTIGHVSPAVVVPDFAEENRSAAFFDRIKHLYPAIRYTNPRAVNIFDALEKVTVERQADVIALSYRTHAISYRLLHENLLKELIAQEKTPLLIFPENIARHD